MLIDTHCHLYFDAYDGERQAVLTRAGEAGVERILAPGIDLATSRAALDLADAHESVHAAVGVHPNSALTWQPGTSAALRDLCSHPKVVAVGEIGLDYYRDRAPKSIQRRVLREQLSLAGQTQLPVVLHVRNASPKDRACITDLLSILAEMRPNLLPNHPGVVHSYSGNQEEAEQVVELGFFLGITGPVTYRNADHLRQVVAAAPIDHLLIETDGPFLTPHPHRGRRNEPAYVAHIAQKIARVRGESPKFIAQKTTENAKKVFGF